MTNEELRQLDAEADAYQAEADDRRKPRYSQDSMDMTRVAEFARGYADCLDRFNRPPGEPGHLPEDYANINIGHGAPFYITRDHEDADPSVGIQAWEMFVCNPSPSMARIITSHAALLEACKAIEYYRSGILSKNFDVDSPSLTEALDAVRAAIAKAEGQQ